MSSCRNSPCGPRPAAPATPGNLSEAQILSTPTLTYPVGPSGGGAQPRWARPPERGTPSSLRFAELCGKGLRSKQLLGKLSALFQEPGRSSHLSKSNSWNPGNVPPEAAAFPSPTHSEDRRDPPLLHGGSTASRHRRFRPTSKERD